MNAHARLPGARRLRLLETRLDGLAQGLPALLTGECVALRVRDCLDAAGCARVLENFLRTPASYEREDGVAGRMVGTNSYLRDPGAINADYARHHGHAELLFEGVDNILRRLYDAVEDAGYRWRRAYLNGVPAATHRAVVWTDRCEHGLALKAHTDWPQVRHSGLEYADVERPIALNFYPRHPGPGQSHLRIYDFVPPPGWLAERDILAGGYPIPLQDLAGMPWLDIEPSNGDLLLFDAAHVHAVFNRTGAGMRLNINGFFGYSPGAGRVLAWA